MLIEALIVGGILWAAFSGPSGLPVTTTTSGDSLIVEIKRPRDVYAAGVAEAKRLGFAGDANAATVLEALAKSGVRGTIAAVRIEAGTAPTIVRAWPEILATAKLLTWAAFLAKVSAWLDANAPAKPGGGDVPPRTATTDVTIAGWVGLPQAQHRVDVALEDLMGDGQRGWYLRLDADAPIAYGEATGTAVKAAMVRLLQLSRTGMRPVELHAYRGPAEGSEPIAVVRFTWDAPADKVRATYDDRSVAQNEQRSPATIDRAATAATQWLINHRIIPLRTPASGPEGAAPAPSGPPLQADCRWTVRVDGRVAQICGRPAAWRLFIDGEELSRNYVGANQIVTALVSRLRAETAGEITIDGEGRSATLRRQGALWRWSLRSPTGLRGGAESSLLDALGVLWQRWRQ